MLARYIGFQQVAQQPDSCTHAEQGSSRHWKAPVTHWRHLQLKLNPTGWPLRDCWSWSNLRFQCFSSTLKFMVEATQTVAFKQPVCNTVWVQAFRYLTQCWSGPPLLANTPTEAKQKRAKCCRSQEVTQAGASYPGRHVQTAVPQQGGEWLRVRECSLEEGKATLSNLMQVVPQRQLSVETILCANKELTQKTPVSQAQWYTTCNSRTLAHEERWQIQGHVDYSNSKIKN